MKLINKINVNRNRRNKRARSKIFGSAATPRLTVFRSNKYLYAQLINDERGETIASASTMKLEGKKISKTAQIAEISKLLAEKAQKIGVKKIIFDKGPYKYHGRVKALADGLRAGGLKF